VKILKRKTKYRVGIGFATGRKSFLKVLKSHIFNWREAGLVNQHHLSLNVFIAYDLTYRQANKTDFTRIPLDLMESVDQIQFIGQTTLRKEINYLVAAGVITYPEASLIFGKGYASLRNAILYSALKHQMDCLLYFDDDEYPVAVTNTRNSVIWGGQQGVTTHLQYIREADVTSGYHCGYISPIPYLNYNSDLSETDFRTFIEAISNDILNWEKVKEVMENGGVTYADTAVLTAKQAQEVPEIKGTKFIAGSNLCLNLKNPDRVFPFYNPPGARGEDAFYSTCLSKHHVLRVPCYTFHDGFAAYNHLLEGVLPTKLRLIKGDNKRVVARFYRACVGWVRYKPLLIYLTQRDVYQDKMNSVARKLELTLPKLARYFQQPKFLLILNEFQKYRANVVKHAEEFRRTQAIWNKIREGVL
jgi:hypothetical protein